MKKRFIIVCFTIFSGSAGIIAQSPDTLYSHWPKVEQEDFDKDKRGAVSKTLAQLLSRPAHPPAEPQTGSDVNKGEAWEQLKEGEANFGVQNLVVAFKHAESALTSAKTAGDHRLEMKALSLLGGISRDVFMGSSLKAVPYHQQALEIATRLRDTTYMISELVSLADNYFQAGKNERFLHYADMAIQLLKHFDVPHARLRLGTIVACMLAETGDANTAKQMFHATLNLANRIKDTGYAQHLHLQLFHVALTQHDAPAARAELEDFRTTGPGAREKDLHERRYQLDKLEGRRDQAFYHLEQAYHRIGDEYVRRNADLLAGWETELHTREREQEVEHQRALLKSQNRARRSLWGILFLLSALVLVSWGAWYVQRRSKKALRRQHDTIEQQAKELRALDQLKSRFFANASHELRTPLTLILAPLAQVLSYPGLPPAADNLLRTVHKGARQLLGLVNDILDLSKLSVTEPALHTQATDLETYLREITSVFLPLAENRAISFKQEYFMQPGAVFALDRLKTQKILNNLLANALKFTPKGGHICLRVKKHSLSEIQIEVLDSGPGIHPDDLPSIFDLYYQTKHPDAKAEGGTGIGLTLSRELARVMGGELKADNRPEGGAVFTLVLPAEEQTHATSAPISSSLTPAIGGYPAVPLIIPSTAPPDSAPRILLVEDNADLQQYLHGLLHADYRLDIAGNGQEALACLESAEHLLDLILTDLMMPVMDGFQLLETLRRDARLRTIPIIMLTARAEQEDRIQAFRTGIDDYLVKPFEPVELFVRIENVLRNQAARREWKALVKETLVPETAEPAMDNDWLLKLERCVRENISDAQFNVDRLAELMNINRKALYQLVREHTGLSVNQYIQELRLLVARERVEAGEVDTLRDLAYSVGFRTVDYFSRLYRERFGKSPAEEL